MNFALSDEHILLRDSAQVFVDDKTDHTALLIPGATAADTNYPDNWQGIVDMGWPSLVVPEADGGAGLGCLDLSVIVMEMGRTLFSSPFAGHTFGTWALLEAGTPDQRSHWLPEVAQGVTRIALVPPMDGNRIVTQNNRLTGQHDFVVDALGVDQLIVAAVNDNGWAFYLVDTHQHGVEIALQPWRDITRQVCKVQFSDVSAEPMAADFGASWVNLLNLISSFLAAENVGGMRQVLSDTVAYANERVAFGRPIGAYQAIKHPLAEMLGKVESANTAALYAAWALENSDDRANEAASIAKSFSSDAYMDATHRNIQVFGAIGFTWEMKNHLYYKRALGNAELFGNSRAHRDRVVNAATGKIWSDPFALSATIAA